MVESALYDKRKECIGLIGDSFSLSSIISLLAGEGMTTQMLGVKAAALIEGETGQGPEGLQVPVYETVEKMLSSNPDINMVMELSGRYSTVEKLRRILPARISLVELPAARFFLRLQASDKLWVACKMDLMQTQAMLKSVVDQFPEDILFINSSGMIMDCNRHFSSLVCMDIQDIRGRNPLEFIEGLAEVCPVTGDGVIDVASMKPGLRLETMYSEVDSQGRMEFYRIYVYPVSEEVGCEVRHLAVMRRNITKRTIMEQRLRKTERMATMGELSAYIAHEIRNPLFAIAGFARSLNREPGIGEKVSEKLEAIVSEAGRLEKLLNSVMGFVRPQDACEMDINEMVESTMGLLSIGCRQQGILVELDLDSASPRAEADAELVKQCLINLVKNSVESFECEGVIRISTGVRREFVFLEVEDNGAGIPKEVRDRVFDPFFSTRKSGNGLGLALVSKIMQDLGGQVELVSREGSGTVITLLLPPVAAVAQKEPT